MFRKGRKTFATRQVVSYITDRQQPWAPQYRCKLILEVTGNIASGAASGVYQVRSNYLALPLNTANPLPNPIGVNVSTANPIGWKQLFAIYQSHRVYGSKIAWTLTPSALTDTVQACIIPSYNDPHSVSLAEAQQNPFAKSMQISSSRGSGRPLTNFITQHKLAGVRRQAIEDDLSSNFTSVEGTAPAQVSTWTLYWETPDAANLATALNYNVKITYFVEFFNQEAGFFANT